MFRAAKKPGVRGLLLTGLLAVALIAPTAAGAASVETSVKPSPDGSQPNLTEILYRAGPGENNEVEVSVEETSGTKYVLRVVDKGAALSAGTGCRGGGPPSSAATCSIEAPRGPEFEIFGAKVPIPKPGTAWDGILRVDLGDQNDVFDSTKLPPSSGAVGQPAPGTKTSYSEPFEVELTGGAGDDRIATDSSTDHIDAGVGSDRVETGAGKDVVVAGAAPDGPDIFNLGSGSASDADEVSYAARTTPVVMENHLAGAEGEGDQLIGVEVVRGGSAGDRLSGGEGFDWLIGEAGNDRIDGGSGADRLDGGLGEDTLDSSRAPHPSAAGPQPVDTYADIVDCGDGKDAASVNPWDKVKGCETVHSVHAADIMPPRRVGDRWRIPIGFSGPGHAVISGPLLRTVEHDVTGSSHGPGRREHATFFALRLTQQARRALNSRGEVRLRVIVVFTPPEGPSRREGRAFRLRAAGR